MIAPQTNVQPQQTAIGCQAALSPEQALIDELASELRLCLPWLAKVAGDYAGDGKSNYISESVLRRYARAKALLAKAEATRHRPNAQAGLLSKS